MLFRISSATVAALAVLAAFAAAQSGPPPLLMRAIAATEAAKTPYAFDFDLETSKQTWRARFDPRATPRLRLVEPRSDALDGSERRAFDRLAERMEGVSWCASENLGRAGDVRLLREDDETAVYAFEPHAESLRGQQARQFADRLRGELTLIKASPDISRVRLHAPEPFSPLPLTRIDELNIVITCQTAPNGRRYAAETVTNLRVTALGRTLNERSVQRARNLAAP